MSDTGQANVGRPDAQVEGGFIFFQYCGGKGGGGCIEPQGITGKVLEYRMPRFVVRNKRIIFENKEFYGVRIYTDGGVSGLCSHSLGVEQGFYIALSSNGALTDAEVQAQGKFITGALPMDIEFLAKDIPQPVEAAWDNRIFVHLYWGNTTFVNEGGIITENSLRVKKHDFDAQL